MAFIDPKLWGASFWATMHWTAAGYAPEPTEEDKTYYKTFYETLVHTLPCMECREHYLALLASMPIDPFLGSGKQLRQWVTSLHNTVNQQTGSSQQWTLEQVEGRYPPAVMDEEEEELLAPEETPSPLPVKTITVPRLPPPLLTTLRQQNLKQMRHQQQILHNNARIMGRVQKPPVAPVRRALPRPVVRTAINVNTPVPLSSVVGGPKKKKGCGCNKRKQ